MWLFLQVAFVTRRKNELEKRVEELIGEREQLNSTLEETSDKIVMLERHAREQDCQVMKMYSKYRMEGAGWPVGSIFGFQQTHFSRFVSVALDGVLEPPCLTQHTRRCPFSCCSGSDERGHQGSFIHRQANQLNEISLNGHT